MCCGSRPESGRSAFPLYAERNVRRSSSPEMVLGRSSSPPSSVAGWSRRARRRPNTAFWYAAHRCLRSRRNWRSRRRASAVRYGDNLEPRNRRAPTRPAQRVHRASGWDRAATWSASALTQFTTNLVELKGSRGSRRTSRSEVGRRPGRQLVLGRHLLDRPKPAGTARHCWPG